MRFAVAPLVLTQMQSRSGRKSAWHRLRTGTEILADGTSLPSYG
jgi:hypothetical protein